MFNVGERVVYPGHGVAEVIRIMTRRISTKVTSFYELQFINKEMKVLVPVEGEASLGIRCLSSNDKINDIFEFLAQPCKKKRTIDTACTNWKQRNKEYQSKLRSGNLKDVSEIYRDLKSIEQQKELSFCEKSLLVQTELLLAQEIALVRKLGEEKAIEHLRSCFSNTISRVPSTGISHKQL